MLLIILHICYCYTNIYLSWVWARASQGYFCLLCKDLLYCMYFQVLQIQTITHIRNTFFFILSIKNECVFILALKFQFFSLSPHFFSFYSSVKLILIPFVTWRKMMDYPISIGIIWNGQITVSRLVQSSSMYKGSNLLFHLRKIFVKTKIGFFIQLVVP